MTTTDKNKPKPEQPKEFLGKTDDLLDCPFCGGRPEWINLEHPCGVPALQCPECQFSMQQDRRDKTWFYWNRRPKNNSEQPISEQVPITVFSKDFISQLQRLSGYDENHQEILTSVANTIRSIFLPYGFDIATPSSRQPISEEGEDKKYWRDRWFYIIGHNPGRSVNHIEDLIEEMMNYYSPSQEAIELAYWKKRAELAEHFIDVDPLYMSKKDKEKWSEYTEHKNSNQ